jgi:hypothetical protein
MSSPHPSLNATGKTLSENDYPLTTTDSIYPVAKESNNNSSWITIPIKRTYTQKKKSINAIVLPERKQRRAETKKIKKEQKEQIRHVIEDYKKRWSKGEPEKMPDKYVTKLDKDLASFFKTGYLNYFSEGKDTEESCIAFVKHIIKKYKLIISGGYILKCISTSFTNALKPSVDVDIYVPHTIPDKYPEFYDTMAKLFNCDMITTKKGEQDYHVNRFIASAKQGKSSFFSKNGIYSVYKHERNVDGLYAEMDLVRAVYGMKATSIVRNFDLSVCMNWYDGEHIYVMDMPGVKKEEPGYLNYSYNTLYEESNVSRDRIYKYIMRGYRIQYLNPLDGKLHEIVEDDLVNAKHRMENKKKIQNALDHPNLSSPSLRSDIEPSNTAK